ncbi:Arc family DNA binding domain-containing protein [Candidatus Latescibacterota bacterium]
MNKKKSLLLRIDKELWNDLNKWSQDELRSINGQIEYILRESIRIRKKRNKPSLPDEKSNAGENG